MRGATETRGAVWISDLGLTLEGQGSWPWPLPRWGRRYATVVCPYIEKKLNKGKV